MADINQLARIIAGVARNVELNSSTPVVLSIKIGGVTNTELTKAILDKLVNLQTGGFEAPAANYHIHDGRYYTESELASTADGAAGSSLIGIDVTPSFTNFTPTANTVQGAIEGIDTALATAGGRVKITAADTTADYLNPSLLVDIGSNTTDALEKSIVSPGADEKLRIRFDASKVSHSVLTNLSADDHLQYILVAGTRAFTGDQSMGSNKLTNLAAGSAAADATRKDQQILRDGSQAWTANQAVGGFKFTGLAAGSTTGDSVRYEQVILRDGSQAFTAAQSMGGFKLTNVADPTANGDAVNLGYMNARLSGLTPKAPARAATTANITLSGAQTIDTVSVVAGNRVLVKNQTLPEENGIYVAASGAWARATDMDSLTPFDEFNGAWTSIQEGSQAGQVYVQYGTVATVGTDPVNFAWYNPIAGLIGGDMITFAGSTFSVDLATSGGLESSNPGNAAGQLRIKSDTTTANTLALTLTANGAGTKYDSNSFTEVSEALALAAGVAGDGLSLTAGVLAVKLQASNPSLAIVADELGVKFDAAGALLSGASGVAVQVDNSTIEISSNALRVKDLGITTAKIANLAVTLGKMAADSVDENKIVSTSFAATGALDGGSGTKISVRVDDVSIEKASNNLRIKTTAYDQLTITGGSGTAASAVQVPLLKKTMVAGEAFAANTSFLVRWALTGETAGRVYKASKDASVSDKFWCVGIALSTSSVSAAGNIDVTVLGSHILGSSDASFAGGDIGKAVWLSSITGDFSTTTPTAATEASFKIGNVESTTKVWVNPQMMGVN
jgi:hypothetical protein